TVEATGIAIQTANHGSLKMYAVYCPPAAVMMEEDLEALLDERGSIIVAGDLNAKHTTWNSRRNNTRGTALFNFTSGRNVEVLGPNEPTHHGGIGQPDVLDIVIVKDLALEAHLDVVNDLSSDHLPVLLRLGRG